MAQIFYIVGRGRSGTAALSRLLNANPQVVVAPEGAFVMNLCSKYRVGRFGRARIDAFIRDLLQEQRMRAWGLDPRRLARRLYEREGALGYAEVCRQVYTSYAEDVLGRTPKWIGDHTRQYALLLEHIDSIFPSARYVHVMSDYREELRGDRGALFALRNPAAVAARWKLYHEEILRLSRKAPERILWLRAEDLRGNTEHELRRVCRFLDVEFDPRMLAAGMPRRERVGPGGEPERNWEHELPERSMRQADAVCGAFAERFGYRPTTLGERPRSVRTRLGALYGCTSVMAERLLFERVSPGLRTRLLNAYTRLSTLGEPGFMAEQAQR